MIGAPDMGAAIIIAVAVVVVLEVRAQGQPAQTVLPMAELYGRWQKACAWRPVWKKLLPAPGMMMIMAIILISREKQERMTHLIKQILL